MQLGQKSVIVLLVLWALAMGLSAWSLLQPATGDGFTRGLNRVMGFFSWQMAAAIVSLGLWIGVRKWPKGETLRWMGRIPGWWSTFALLALIVLVVYSAIAVRQGSQIPDGIGQPPPTQPEVTAPSD